MNGPARLRVLLGEPSCVVAPGAADAWTARIIEQAGFQLVYLTGAGVANTLLGRPDIGLTTLTEMARQARYVVDAVGVPVLADGDTGHGGPDNVARTIREFEAAGVAGIHLEDQAGPKRCGHFEGASVVPVDEMLARLDAALTARRNDDFVVFARTDALRVEGLDAAIRRGRRYLEAGADGLFVEAAGDRDELQAVADAFPAVPLIANVIEGRTSVLASAELGALGFRIALHANLALRLAGHAVRYGLEELQRTGTSETLVDRMLTWEERQAVVGADPAIVGQAAP